MLKVLGGEQKDKFKAVASGSLPNGKPVVVNSDGTVSVISETSVSAQTTTPTTFTTNTIQNFLDATYDSGNDRVVVVYSDGSNSNYGTAVVGTVSSSDNSITFGTPVVFDSLTARSPVVAYDANAGKVVVAYFGFSSPNTGLAIVGTVSGSSISFGSRVTMNATGPSQTIGIVYAPDQQKIVCSYRDQYNSDYGTAIVGTVSGTSISFGTEVVFNSGTTYQNTLGYDTTKNRVLCAYRDNSNLNYGTIIAGTVSGTSITFGSEAEFHNSSAGYPKEIVHDSVNNINVIVYGNSFEYGLARTVSIDTSDNSLTFGTAAQFKGNSIGSSGAAAFNAAAGKIDIIYKDEGDVNKAKFVTATVSGTSISYSSETTVDTNQTDFFSVVYNTTLKNNFIAYSDETNTQGEAFVNQLAYTETNLTAENYIGMSKGVVDVTGSASQVIGAETNFETGGRVEHVSAAYDANAQKVVIAYRDNTNSNYGTAIVGTVSGTTITFGTAVVFHADVTQYTSVVYDANAQKVVIAYQDDNDLNKGTAVVGTVSGTSISFGTPTVFDTDNAFINTVYDANAQKIVISYQDGGNSNYGTAVVGTVSGTSISFGTPVVFESADTRINDIVYDSTAQKVIVAYRDFGNSDAGTARVGTVSGTSISFGTVAVFDSGGTDRLSAAYDVAANATVIFYGDKANSYYGTAIVGTVSGTSISFGTKQVFESAEIREIGATYDSVAQRAVLGYRDVGNTERGTIIAAQVDGTVMTFSTPEVFAENPRFIGATYDSGQENVVFVYDDEIALRGRACVVQVGYENISRYPVADGDPARVDIIGSVSDNQLSLTAGEKYYVQTDGTLSTTAGSPSVLAGTAISATKLVVKT